MNTRYTPDRIAETLFGKTRRRVLGLLYSRSDEAFYLRQVARLTGTSPGAVQRELEALTDAGLLIRKKDGRQVYFRANEESPVFDDLRNLIAKTAGLAGMVQAALKPLAAENQIDWAFLYGSVASGEHSAASDIDLMVIGDAGLTTVATAIRPLQDELNRDINPSIYPTAEFRAKIAAKDHFLTSVLEGKRIMLVGSEDDLRGVARESLAD